MEYLIFNAESIPYKSEQEAKDNFPEFVHILRDALSTQLTAVLISNDLDPHWYNILIAPDFYCRNWVKTVDIDLGRKFKSLSANSKLLKVRLEELELLERFELSDFFLKEININTPSLGAAYLSNQLAVSVGSQDYWKHTLIKLRHYELTYDGNQEDSVSVRNFFNDKSWEEYKHNLLNERKQSLIDLGELWNNRDKEFPHLILLDKKHFTKLSCSKTIYIQLVETLQKLNQYCKSQSNNFSLQNISEETNLTISDESDTVKQNPKLRHHREFRVNDERIFFGYHCKNFSGSFRLHFYPDPELGKIYIGYFGKHLPL